MARTPNTDSILQIAEVWRDQCVLADGAIFSSEQLWTAANADELEQFFIDRPDTSDRKFDEKLKDQLVSASPPAVRLAAEMLWTLLLFPNNLRRETKVELVQKVWSWSGAAIPASHPAFQAMGIGIGSGGRAYNVQRPNELTLFIRAMQDWKARSPRERSVLLGDPWAFATWLDTIPGADRRQFRHMLLHLLYPDTFERVSSGTDKESIDSEFRAEIDGEVLPPEEIATSLVARDRRLLRIRRALELKQPGVFVDFYLNSDLLNQWKPPEDAAGTNDGKASKKPGSVAKESRVAEVRTSQGGGYEEPSLDEIVEDIQSQLKLSARTIRRYHLALKSRGFVILGGVSGTGKTWLAEQYATAVGARHLVVPVAPNWTTNEDLLGFSDPFTGDYRDTAFRRFLRDASSGAEQARKAGQAPQPFHLILDEMNLARVEYYFAKFLSAMELRMRAGEARIELSPKDQIALPQNLYFIGTVNIDETTHGFSDKVYDRAQLIELPADREALDKHLGGAPYRAVVMQIWDAINPVAPFAFRVLDDVGKYIASAQSLGVKWEDLLDELLLQKMLPKLKGTDPRVGDALGALSDITTGRFPLSHDKIQSMQERFRNHGFVSYF
jgi:MoxR-like ATPase